MENTQKELTGVLDDHEKVLASEKAVRLENEKYLSELNSLREELAKAREEQAQILNEVVDPEYFSKSHISAGAGGLEDDDNQANKKAAD